MAKFHFSLVSPERELYSAEVDQVDASGVEGDFGVLAAHAPFMTALKPSRVNVRDGSTIRVFQIEGGFADVTPQGFTLLAEQAVEVV
jgi:F-type H+-transporting ATPase subunit epsilon